MEGMARVLAAAGNPQRLSIMKLLADQKQVLYSDIMKRLELTTGNLGFHLKELVDTKLVQKQRGDRYTLTDLGLRLMAWTGEVSANEQRLLQMKFNQKMMEMTSNMMNPLRNRQPGNNMEWLGGFVVVVGIVSIILGAAVAVTGILLVAGCATALGGASLNYLATIHARNIQHEDASS